MSIKHCPPPPAPQDSCTPFLLNCPSDHNDTLYFALPAAKGTACLNGAVVAATDAACGGGATASACWHQADGLRCGAADRGVCSSTVFSCLAGVASPPALAGNGSLCLGDALVPASSPSCAAVADGYANPDPRCPSDYYVYCPDECGAAYFTCSQAQAQPVRATPAGMVCADNALVSAGRGRGGAMS